MGEIAGAWGPLIHPPGPGKRSMQEDPLRAELFDIEQLAAHARALGASHRVALRRGPNPLLARLDANEKILRAYNQDTTKVERTRRLTPAAEWLLDNFYLIKEQIQTTRRHLPKKYSSELPRLVQGPWADYPRVYHIALELISHVDGRVDSDQLMRFVAAYQETAPLTLGELWAVPIMLRLALIENLRRVAVRLSQGRQERDAADFWADRLLEIVQTQPADLIIEVARLAQSHRELPSAFVAEFIRKLQGQSPSLQLARSWVEHRLADRGLTVDQLIQLESQSQASDQVSIGNSITSLRSLGAMDWREFVETLSGVEQILRLDPAGVYPHMDFVTRDRYRHAVEQLARWSPQSEAEVAKRTVALAKEGGPPKAGTALQHHIGYYLVDDGFAELERSVGARRPLRSRLIDVLKRFPLPVYLGSIFLITAVLAAAMALRTRELGLHGWILGVVALLLGMAASQLAVSLVNWILTLLVTPTLLPRMDYSEGIPSQDSTVVAVPTMLGSFRGIDKLLDDIEIRYLSNRDENLRFILLTDFTDAASEQMPEDDRLLKRIKEGVEALNLKYESDRPSIFFLCHRPRRWNPKEGVWMGYERKRGKLSDLNALLRGRGRDRFSVVVGDLDLIEGAKFVITLDTDTSLPGEAARRLVATLAHPLNHPCFDPAKGRVTRGYTILQPRVGVNLPTANRSWFSRLFAGDAGIDPYTRAVSDVYQDLFGEGSFIGKGIYQVDTFEQAAGCFPENAILSHDLLEACHARSGLVTDVEVFEEHPSSFHAEMSRRHRWIRGDWQIAPWLLSRVPSISGGRKRNPLSGISHWKIFDNLRRSLVPPALVLLLLIGWIFGPAVGSFLTGSIVVLVLASAILAALFDLARKPSELPPLFHLRRTMERAGRHFGQALFGLAVLPYEALLDLDAIGRTLARLWITRRHLLQWQTSSEAERTARGDLAGFYRTMIISPVLTLLILAGARWAERPISPSMIPFLGGWFLSPLLCYLISRPRRIPPPHLTPRQILYLRVLARKTWRFFETFVGPEENWLPPDNWQEEPPVTATRTSPTNIGLSLLGALAAHDFGYLTRRQLLERTENIFRTMDRLERHRGHFYNWYSTTTLQPLFPLYISTVDSGNLAGHLLTLAGGLQELPRQNIISGRLTEGIRDTLGALHLAVSAALKAGPGSVSGSKGIKETVAEIENLQVALSGRSDLDLGSTYTLLQRMVQSGREIATLCSGHADDDVVWWSAAFQQSAESHLQELASLAPWLAVKDPIALADQRSLPGSAREEWETARSRFNRQLSLQDAAQYPATLIPLVERLAGEMGGTNPAAESVRQFEQLAGALAEAAARARSDLARLEELVRHCADCSQMDFNFLYDSTRDLFSIGYNVSNHRRDQSFYDLFASEARLSSYIAIALGQVRQDHWFALGRALVPGPGSSSVLVSWSGSMFEYLMPLLVMPTYENTLLHETYTAAVARQIEYGQQRGVAWGISESGYNLTDALQNYQYRAFGVPGLGLKRGLAEDLVVAPYATMLALMVAPEEAVKNLERLSREGREGSYGFYEAIDYQPARLPPGQSSVTIRSFMAHHQGMSLLALAYLLLQKPMQRRFLTNPHFKARELLLHERVPAATSTESPAETDSASWGKLTAVPEGTMRVFTNPSSAAPAVHLLSNGRYHVMISSAGSGYSRWKDLAVTRWREDSTRDCWGSFCYIRDVESGRFWSTGYQPALRPAKQYEAIFTQGRAELRNRFQDLEMHSQISVSPEDDIELRRLTLSNRSRVARSLEITSYSEIVLAPQAADSAHPAFSNLFVQTKIVSELQAIVATRRPRSASESAPWLLHVMVVHGQEPEQTSYETDRSKFLGRMQNAASPRAMAASGPLSNTAGSVLDPIVAIRQRVVVPPESDLKLDIIYGMADTQETALNLVRKYRDSRIAERAIELAWTHSQVELRHLNATENDAQLFGRLASALIYANPFRRAAANVLVQNKRAQSNLWGYGISGDLPIVLLKVSDAKQMDMIRQTVQAHAYWRLKGLVADLVVLNEDDSGYRQSLQDQMMSLIGSGIEAQMLEKPGGIFIRRAEQMATEDRLLLEATARIVLDQNGVLPEQVDRRSQVDLLIPRLAPARVRPVEAAAPRALAAAGDLAFFNGLGGFTRDGREYIITLKAGEATPAPWVNVIANSQLGTVISEGGSAYTWAENAHEFRLTPWYNDPVSDTSGEAFYLRDEQTGQFWSPTPLPVRGTGQYRIRHGFGYTVFEHEEQGIFSELTVYVAIDAPVKFSRLKVKNVSGRPRQLSVFGYCELVLGELKAKSSMHVITEVDGMTGALMARNSYHPEFAGRIVFADLASPGRSLTADRTEFLGRNGSPADPAALARTHLSGKTGAGLDPCAAFFTAIDLLEDEERELTFMLGAGRGVSEARELIQKFRGRGVNRKVLEAVWEYWNRALSALRIETPDPATNFLANGWLVYQTLSCRFWARTGFYQSGGAYGFRDQLQDVMALVYAEPRLVREHILRASSRQFPEGDVQHWWHPPSGRGVRTHFSDDYLWLPYAVCRYVSATGDHGILDEQAAFLEGRLPRPDEEAYYDLPASSHESAPLYHHCVRAIEHGLRMGSHGLPLMGCGDWNDGMNLVGAEGRGESVWLAFFLYDVLKKFSDLARFKNDLAFAERCRAEAEKLRSHIESEAWDGGWYRRAFFDNGEPLGSAQNPECQIDSLPQSWSVISGAGDAERSRIALESVLGRLVRRDARLIQLFTPPFDKSPLNPGYIKGYLPGVRENGGQYTHAAIWTVMAFALGQQPEVAWDLFSMINPVRHGGAREAMETYKVEPYVVAADVYGVAPHTGRGGWTWYTGSAGWMYRLIIESFIGFSIEGEKLFFRPCLPKEWTSVRVDYRFRETYYHFVLKRKLPGGSRKLVVDGVPQAAVYVALVDDRRDHQVELEV